MMFVDNCYVIFIRLFSYSFMMSFPVTSMWGLLYHKTIG